LARKLAAVGGREAGAGRIAPWQSRSVFCPAEVVDRWRKRRRCSRRGEIAFGRKKVRQNRGILLPPKCAKAARILGNAASHSAPPHALMDVLEATRRVATLLSCYSGNTLILLGFKRRFGRGERADFAAKFRGGNVTRLSKTSAPPRIAIYLPEGIRISTRRTLLSGGFCHVARDGALLGDAGRLIRTESLD
jgi:hypothetical protein